MGSIRGIFAWFIVFWLVATSTIMFCAASFTPPDLGLLAVLIWTCTIGLAFIGIVVLPDVIAEKTATEVGKGNGKH